MESQSYYRFIDVESNNSADDSAPLIVNCVGYAYLDRPFHSENTRQDYYIQFMDKGTLRLKQASGWTDFLPGQFIIHRRGTRYEYELPAGHEAMGYFWAHFTGFHVEKLLSNANIEPNRLYSVGGQNSNTKRAFSGLFREFMMRDIGFEDSCAALLTGLIVELGRNVSSGGMESMVKSRFAQSLSYIHSHYTADIKIGELAAMEHLSVSRFRDVFRIITGMSPAAYIISLRIQRACELLTTTDYTVTQISAICGYPDVLYFIRLFKRKTGVTPGAYR